MTEVEQVQATTRWPHGAGTMAGLIRARDWASSPLGAAEGWSAELRAAVATMLAQPMLSTLVVGPERLFLYNDQAAPLYGARHPAALGRPLPDSFPDAWAQVAGFYDRVFAGESLHVPAQPLDVAGDGVDELFDAYLSPVRDGDGRVIAAQMTGFAAGERLRARAALDRAEMRRAFLLRLSDALRPLSDAGDIQHVAARMAGEHWAVAHADLRQDRHRRRRDPV